MQANVILRPNLSQETLSAVRAYLSTFTPDRYSIISFGGKTWIHFKDSGDIALIDAQFPNLIESTVEVF
jgi:hypothetical protein